MDGDSTPILNTGMILRATDGTLFEIAELFPDGAVGCNVYTPDDWAAVIPAEWREVLPEALAGLAPCRPPRRGDRYATPDGEFMFQVTVVCVGHVDGILWSVETYTTEAPREVSLFDLMDMVLVH